MRHTQWPRGTSVQSGDCSEHMKRFELLRCCVRNEEGATALEYGFLGCLIAAVIVANVQSLGDTVVATFASVVAALGSSGL